MQSLITSEATVPSRHPPFFPHKSSIKETTMDRISELQAKTTLTPGEEIELKILLEKKYGVSEVRKGGLSDERPAKDNLYPKY